MFEGLPERALSIRQPWAWAILHAGKRIENRPRRFHYRGPICLHASMWNSPNKDQAGIDFVETTSEKFVFESALLRGGIIGTADIVDCIDSSDDPWFFGPYGLVLDNVKAIDFVHVKGALGLFNWRRNL